MARPKTRVEWTVYLAGQEFGRNERTLHTQLSGVKPAYGEKYSTQQILKAAFGDMAGAKLRKLNAEADDAQIVVERKKGILIDAAHMDTTLRKVFITAKQMVEGWEDITAERKDELLNGLHAVYSAFGERKGEIELRGPAPELANPQSSPEA